MLMGFAVFRWITGDQLCLNAFLFAKSIVINIVKALDGKRVGL
jgi:hypothetical protein